VVIKAAAPADGRTGDDGGADRRDHGGDEAAGWYGLGPLSVLPFLQGQGLGSTLVGKGLAQLESRGARGCVVLGEPAYYRRFGFRSSSRLVAEGLPPEYFMFLPFGENAPPTGIVLYHPAFFGSR
jgi:putative acetyltransferase